MEGIFRLNLAMSDEIRKKKELLGEKVTWEAVILAGLDALSKKSRKSNSSVSAKAE